MAQLLTVENLRVAYGAIEAVRGLSLNVNAGEIVCLVGPNGAGKTSTLSAVTGLVRSAGHISFCGQRIDGLPPEAIVRMGLTLCPEGRRLFPELTVEENLLAGTAAARGRVNRGQRLESMYARFPVLGPRREQRAGTLSGGEQQMVALARALISEPRALLLDEPSLGLAPQIVDNVFTLIAELRKQGYAMLLVEQNVERALEIADRAYVLVNGAITLAATAAEVRAHTDMQSQFFGST